MQQIIYYMPNIELSGFKDVDGVVVSIINDKINRFVSKVRTEDFRLSINLKLIHETEKSEKYELTGNFKGFKPGQNASAKIEERDLIKGINMLLNKIERSIN